MTTDVLADLGHLFLGSRLKRLAERLQADAAKVNQAMGIHAQPAELALLAAIDRRGPLTVSSAVEALGVSQPAVTRTASALVERGLLVSTQDEADLRHKTHKLTAKGRALVTKAKSTSWPAVDAAVSAMCAPLEGTLLEQISVLESQLAARPLDERALEVAAGKPDDLTIVEYSDALAESFYAINAEWIESMFSLEAKDEKILRNPRKIIIEPGGVILFAISAELGVVGTCALMKVEDGVFELTKMGVLERARGRQAGQRLLAAALERAEEMELETLYLLTNSKCAAAIHLYEQAGFVHDAAILKTYGATYARCNVGMRYVAS